MTSIKESAASRSKLPQTAYSWAEVGGVRLGDGSFAAIGAIVHEDQAYAGYGCPVRILSACSTEDGRATWVTVQRLDYRTMLPIAHYTATRVLYHPGHLWRSAELSNDASKARALGNHRITEWS